MKQEKKPEVSEFAISRLEYFAGEALRGILANPNPNIKSEMVTEMAMVYAEGMMKEFEKTDLNLPVMLLEEQSIWTSQFTYF